MHCQNTEDSVKDNQSLYIQTHPPGGLFLALAGIDDVLHELFGYLQARIDAADRETVSFCLRHIFYYTDQVYSLLLPELTLCTQEDAHTESDYTHSRHMPMRNLPLATAGTQYRIWSLLQAIEAALARLTPLCQLIISAATSIIARLDQSCALSTVQAAITHTEEQRADQDCNAIHDPWQLAQVRQRITQWQHQARLSFSLQFSILGPMIPALPYIDGSMDGLLQSVSAIFASALPESPAIQHNGDEYITTLLLDISQRCDQILFHLGILGEPLHLLMAQYTLETTLQ